MYVTKDKRLAINTDLVQTARLADDGSVTVSLGQNAATMPPGEDADALAKQFGLSLEKDDKNAKGDPTHQHEPAKEPAHSQAVKR